MMVLLPLISLLLLLIGDSHGNTSLPCQEDKDASGVNTGSPYAPSSLTCYRQWASDEQMSGDKSFQCVWSRGREPAEYRLCYCCDSCKTCRQFPVGNKTSHVLNRDDFYLSKNLTFWLETTEGKVKSAKLYVVPKNAVKYAPLLMEKVNMARSANRLTLRWKKPEMERIFNQIRYRRPGSEVWKQTMCSSPESTHENCTIQLDASSAHQLQIRRMLQTIWSEWSDLAFIPAAITKRLELQWGLVDNLPQCPGKRLVELKWQSLTEPDIGVTGYRLTVRPLIDGMGRIKEELNQTSYRTMLSLAPYKVSVVALNRVGSSPSQTITVPAGRHEGPPELNLTAVDNHTLKASWIQTRDVSFYCAVLQLVSTGTIQHYRCLPAKHQKHKKKNGSPRSTGMKLGTADARTWGTMEFVGLEPLRGYRLTIYTKDLKEKKKCRGKTGYTIGSVTACTQEQPPTQEPSVVNVTSIMKTSAFIKWKGISLGECQGILENYLIIYTDSGNHTHSASVNASSRNFTLTNLNASTLYTVLVRGISSVGQGAVTSRIFKTEYYDRSEFLAIIVSTSIFVMLGVFIMVSLCYLSFKRTQRLICPVVPDPVNSLALKCTHISDHVGQWEACSADEDVTDALLVMVMAQSGAPSPDTPGTVPATEGGEPVGDGDGDGDGDDHSLGSGGGSAFGYRRQMGGDNPSALEEVQRGAQDGVDAETESQGPHLPPVNPQPRPGSGLDLGPNVISLLSVYDQTVAEQDPAGSHVHV